MTKLLTWKKIEYFLWRVTVFIMEEIGSCCYPHFTNKQYKKIFFQTMSKNTHNL